MRAAGAQDRSTDEVPYLQGLNRRVSFPVK